MTQGANPHQRRGHMGTSRSHGRLPSAGAPRPDQARPGQTRHADAPRPAGALARHARARRRSTWLGLGITAAVVLGLVVVVHAVVSGGGASQGAAASGGSSPAGITTGRAAPAFTLTTLAGTSFSLARARGHPVVLYFMATTCDTCVQGSQDLAQAMQSAHVAGATAVAIDLNPGDTPADLASFVQATGVPATAPVVWGIDTHGSIAQAYGVQTLETTVVIDARGDIAYEQASSVAPQQLAQLVHQAV